MGCNWSICWNFNIWDVFWMNQVQMRQYFRMKASGRRVAGAIRSWLMLGGYSLSVLGSCMSHCSCLFLCMVVK